MSWIWYAIGAITAGAFSDLFRKLGSNLKDPFFSNLVFQTASFVMAIVLFMLFSRQTENNSRGILFAVVGGLLISLFTTFLFKALATGPGVSTVVPIVRVGAVLLVAVLGVLLFKDKLTWNLALGVVLACVGVYLIFV